MYHTIQTQKLESGSDTKPTVKLNVLGILDNSFPGFAECELIDCNGTKHIFIDKLPVVTADDDAVPPCIGAAKCRILEEKEDTFLIDTSFPDDMESTDGKVRFEVYKNQVTL